MFPETASLRIDSRINSQQFAASDKSDSAMPETSATCEGIKLFNKMYRVSIKSLQFKKIITK